MKEWTLKSIQSKSGGCSLKAIGPIPSIKISDGLKDVELSGRSERLPKSRAKKGSQQWRIQLTTAVRSDRNWEDDWWISVREVKSTVQNDFALPGGNQEWD
jgi:hypothetical protein